MLEARAAGDVDGTCLFLHPQIEAVTSTGATLSGIEAVRAHIVRTGARTEVHAHRIELRDDDVVVYGRLRLVDAGSLVDSPAAWRFAVVDGKVRTITPAAPRTARPVVLPSAS